MPQTFGLHVINELVLVFAEQDSADEQCAKSRCKAGDKLEESGAPAVQDNGARKVNVLIQGVALENGGKGA